MYISIDVIFFIWGIKGICEYNNLKSQSQHVKNCYSL